MDPQPNQWLPGYVEKETKKTDSNISPKNKKSCMIPFTDRRISSRFHPDQGKKKKGKNHTEGKMTLYFYIQTIDLALTKTN